MKKGQITIFIIIGMIIAALIMISFIFKDSIVEQAKKVEVTKGLVMSKEARKVQSEMESCITNLAGTGLVVLGLQGGYTALDTKTHYTDTKTTIRYIPYSGTAYHYFKGQNLVPTKEVMEKQIASFIEDYSLVCEPQYPGLEVDYGNLDVLVNVEDDEVKINVNSAVKVKKEEKESGFNTLRTEVPVRLGTMQGLVNDIVDKQIKVSDEELCISCISRIAAENDVEVSIDKVGNDIFYMVTDDNSKILGGEFIFLLANKF